MNINPISLALGASELVSELTDHTKERKHPLAQATNPAYDVNNMSFNDLADMALTLVQQGSLSEKDSSSLLAHMDVVQKSSGVAQDVKTDLIQLYEHQLHKANTVEQGNEVASLQQSLNLLHGIKARSGALIPQAV
jgi:hypothetical protein